MECDDPLVYRRSLTYERNGERYEKHGLISHHNVKYCRRITGCSLLNEIK